MNKRFREVLTASLNDEKKHLKWLEQVYSQASKDTADKIAELSSRKDLENLQTIVYQKQYQEAIQKQINDTLDRLHTQSFKGISDYMNTCYVNGYTGAMYDIAGQGIPIVKPIDEVNVLRAIQTDSKLSKGLYNRLGEDINALKLSIRAEVSRGIIEGSSWNDIATHIAKGMNSPFNKSKNIAMRIARTEGHRIQNEAQMDAITTAKEEGADVLKQWDATLDDRTRESHQMVDGEVREIDEEFSNGLMFPSDPTGDAEEVINCRCALTQRARWALDEDELETLKDRAEYFGLDKSENFEDFKDKYLKLPDDADTMDISIPLADLLENCKDSKEVSKVAQEYFRNKADCRIEKVNLAGIDLDASKSIVLKFDDLDNRFESSLTELKSASLSSSLCGQCTPTDYTGYLTTGNKNKLKCNIQLNKMYLSDKKTIQSDWLDHKKVDYNGLHSTVFVNENNASVCTAVHEYGHSVLQGKLNELYISYGGKNEAFIECQKLYDEYMTDLRDINHKINQVKDVFTGVENGLQLGLDATEGLRNEYADKCISNYSKESVGEFIAESFCDAELNDNPKEYSKKVHDVLVKYYGKGA